MMHVLNVYVFVVASAVFFLSCCMTKLFRDYAIQHDIVDTPNERSSHTIPVPRGGGVVFVVVFLTLLWFVPSTLDHLALLMVFSAGFLVALVGFLDDKYTLPFYWRLVAQFFSVAMVLYGLGGAPVIELGIYVLNANWMLDVFAALALMWLLNAYNFMDGIDGLAAMEAIFVCLGAVVLYYCCGFLNLIVLPLLLGSVVGGFLYWNVPTARIFMGDVGSGFLGLMLGVLALQSALLKPVLLWSWLIFLSVFVVDATMTLLHRWLRGEKIHQAHCSHAYQKAARVFKNHMGVTLGVLVLNILWLWPFAVWVGLGRIPGWLGFVVAYTPVVLLAEQFQSGRPDKI